MQFKKKKQDLILNEHWYESQKKKNDDEKDDAVLAAAVKILRKRIDDKKFTNGFSHYEPAEKSFSNINEDIPEDLLKFLEDLIHGKKKPKKSIKDLYFTKISSIAHSIVTACRPKSFYSPLLLAVGVTLHRTFGSKKMISIFNSLGNSCSYNEVRRYEASVTMQKELKIDIDAFVQFVYDNADFNVDTLDGKFTFHNLGGIMIITPKSMVHPREKIERLAKIPTAEDTARVVDIPLETRAINIKLGYKSLTYKVLNKKLELKTSENSNLRNFWMFLKYTNNMHFEGWNAYMQNITSEKSYEISVIEFLPFIYSPPSDIKTLFTAMRKSCDEAKKLGMKTCIITFDQPLYFKARAILAAVPDSFGDIIVIIRLGGFHTILSFLGVFDHNMAGSGLK